MKCNCYLLFFADDAVAFATEYEALQSILNDIERNCQQSKLKLNVAKSKIMTFENRGNKKYGFYLY